MATRNDEELGPMSGEGCSWTLQRTASLGGASVPIEIESDEEGGFEAGQREAVRLALALGPGALEEAAPVVAENFEEIDDEQTPPLERAADVWQQVRIERIRVPRHYEARHAYFLIDAECNWDFEHGLEVRFRDGVAIEAGQAGDTGGAWDNTPEELEALRERIARANAQFDA